MSVAGPALGGGHRYLHGQKGLVADQMVSARVVLADGEVVTASEEENEDLFWAIRGAGHNFGVVTEMVYKAFDVVRPEWAFEYLFLWGIRWESFMRLPTGCWRLRRPRRFCGRRG